MKYTLFIALIFSIMISSCKKEEGEGGKSTITGRIFEEKYILTFHDSTKDHWAQDQDVFIVYGDDKTYGNKVSTSPDGVFEFKYLRKGDYTIYVYSDSTSYLKKAIYAKFSIPKSGTTDAGTIVIQDITN